MSILVLSLRATRESIDFLIKRCSHLKQCDMQPTSPLAMFDRYWDQQARIVGCKQTGWSGLVRALERKKASVWIGRKAGEGRVVQV